MFITLEFVGVTADEDVDVELSLDQGEGVGTSPGHDLMAVTETDAELADRHHFLLRVIQVLKLKGVN